MFCLFAGAALADAAVMPRFSLEELVARSEIIGQAQVLTSWPAWDANHKYIWTHYQMRITEAFRGQPQLLVVSEPGGTVDGISQAFSGMTAWTPGENVILFLHHVPNGYLRVTGGAQGAARISPDGRVSLQSSAQVALSDFKARVRTAVEQHPLMRQAQ